MRLTLEAHFAKAISEGGSHNAGIDSPAVGGQ